MTLPETASFNEVEGGIWRPRIADCSNMFECSSEFPLMKLTRCPVRYCSVEGICKLQIGSMVQHLCELAAAMAMGASRTGLRRLTGLPHSNMLQRIDKHIACMMRDDMQSQFVTCFVTINVVFI